MPPDMAAQMARLMPGAGLDAAQSNEIAGLQKTIGAPLSSVETVGTIDEMVELGLLSAGARSELEECLLLQLETAPLMGMAIAAGQRR